MSRFQLKHRAAGDQARRAVLVRSGLGELLSQPQLRSMRDQFNIDVTNVPETRIEEHFASRRGASVRRLAEMLIESTYWMRDLQAGSAWLFGGFCLTGLVVFVAVMWRATVTLNNADTLNLLRISIAFMVFLLSSDIVGAFLGHLGAVSTLDTILKRLEAAELADFPEPDVLLLMADCNAAVEGSPIVLPIVYKVKARALSRAWHSYAAAHTFWRDQ